MSRAGRWAIKKARSERWRTVRRNIPLLAALSGWVLGLGGLMVLGLARIGQTYLAAAFAGAFVTGWIAAISTALAVDGSSFRQMGGLAERWTSKAFRKLPPASWTVFDNLRTDRGDVDHVVIGPNHILAVETKWTSKIMAAHENGHLRGVPRGWVWQAKDSARQVALMLREADSGVEVKPVLIIWGPGISRTERGWFKTGGVTVLIGRQAGDWRQHLEPSSWAAAATHTALPILQSRMLAAP